MMTSNTGSNSGKFTKGDPRINRKGRPKSFDALRALAQEIANEEAKNGDRQIVINGHIVTIAEAILRQWATSKNPQLQMRFVEVAYGKVPDKLDVTSKGEKLEQSQVVIFIPDNGRDNKDTSST